MICKYCGSRMDGQKCPSCGRESPQIVRSMQLDELMAGPVTKPAASSKPAPAPKASPVPNASAPAAPGPTYDQGVREGYQRGLQEGYENGRREGLAEAPAPRKGGVRPAVVALLCAACLAVAALGSGIVMRGIGRNEGTAEEKAKNTPLPVPTVSSEQLAEFDRKLEEERSKAEKAEKELEEFKENFSDELEKAREEARSEGQLQQLVNLNSMNFPYQKKSGKDETVQEIQEMLDALRYFPEHNPEKTVSDGKFGDNTQDAVTAFQLASGLISDDRDRKGNLTDSRAGVVDMETYVRLLLAFRGAVPAPPVPSDDPAEEETPEPTAEPIQEPTPEPSPEPTPTPAGKKTPNQTDNNRNIVPTPDPSGSDGSDAGTMPTQPGDEPSEAPAGPAPSTAPPISSDTDLAQKMYISRIL